MGVYFVIKKSTMEVVVSRVQETIYKQRDKNNEFGVKRIGRKLQICIDHYFENLFEIDRCLSVFCNYFWSFESFYICALILWQNCILRVLAKTLNYTCNNLL